jgi:hypothetical protein
MTASALSNLPDRASLCAKRRTAQHRAVKGERNQAIGRSRATKIHAPTDPLCRPIAFLLTGRRRLSRRKRQLLVMSPDPSTTLAV